MNATGWTTTEIGMLIAVALLLVAGLATLLVLRARRSRRLRSKLGGAEYALAVEQGGTRRRGEAGLEQRSQRVDRLDVRPLAPADRGRYAASWQSIQARFVNSPAGAVAEAEKGASRVTNGRAGPAAMNLNPWREARAPAARSMNRNRRAMPTQGEFRRTHLSQVGWHLAPPAPTTFDF